ncbi:MAG TPA: LuxR C-terminal-related transcriptional regulator, partial [Polyangiaceae bacterium]
RIFGDWLSSGRPFAHFDATCPDPRQRNSVVTLTALRQLVPLRPEDEAIYTELWPSMGLTNFEQLRVLVCEGDSLLAWVGGFQESTPRPGQVRALEALAPALQRRLSWERWIGDLAGRAAGLEQLIDSNLRPTFLLGRNARIIAENGAGRAWLMEDRDQVLRLLGDLGTGGNRSGVDVMSVNARSFGQPLTLATLSRPVARAHPSPSPSHAYNARKLPPRLRRVALAVARGLTDKEVAGALGLSVSTVRTYVRQLYGLLGVHNRVQLASAISRP